MKKLLVLLAALFLCLCPKAYAEGGVRIEVITMDGMSVVQLIPEGMACDEDGIMLGSAPEGAFVLPPLLTTIGEEAFAGISAKRVSVSENVTAIGARAFADCGSLREIYIPSTVEEIDDTALSGSDNVTVYGVTDSPAHVFALKNGIPFVDPDNPAVPGPVVEPPPAVLPAVTR